MKYDSISPYKTLKETIAVLEAACEHKQMDIKNSFSELKESFTPAHLLKQLAQTVLRPFRKIRMPGALGNGDASAIKKLLAKRKPKKLMIRIPEHVGRETY